MKNAPQRDTLNRRKTSAYSIIVIWVISLFILSLFIQTGTRPSFRLVDTVVHAQSVATVNQLAPTGMPTPEATPVPSPGTEEDSLTNPCPEGACTPGVGGTSTPFMTPRPTPTFNPCPSAGGVLNPDGSCAPGVGSVFTLTQPISTFPCIGVGGANCTIAVGAIPIFPIFTPCPDQGMCPPGVGIPNLEEIIEDIYTYGEIYLAPMIQEAAEMWQAVANNGLAR